MAPSSTCDGDVYLHNLSTFIKSHERQLANALLAYKKQPKNSSQSQHQAAMLNSKPVRLSLTLHHLYYLLERFQDLGISVGPMNIRLDNIHNDDTSLNYVSFLSDFHQNKRMSSDAQSIHSMTSVKSVMSSVSALWTSMGSGSGINSRDVLISDLKYLYSAFTKLPCLRLAPDSRAKLIEGHEEYPFDTAVPIKAFKNLSVLEICDLSLKEVYGWNIIAEQIKFLVLKKTNINDPVEVLVELVEEDEQARGSLYEENSSNNNLEMSNGNIASLVSVPKHASFSTSSSSTSITNNSNELFNNNNSSNQQQQQYHSKRSGYNKHHLSSSHNSFYQLSGSLPENHYHQHQRTSPTLNHATLSRQFTGEDVVRPRKNTSHSAHSVNIQSPSNQAVTAPYQPNFRRSNTSYLQQQSSTSPPSAAQNHMGTTRRTWRSNSTASEEHSISRSTPTPPPLQAQVPMLETDTQAKRWKALKHLSFTENHITTISDWSFQPLVSLSSLDLSHNKLSHIPSALSHLKNLKSLNLSYNKLESTAGFQRNELTKLTILNLKSNRLKDLSSLEFLKNLEKLDLRSNKLETTDLKPLLMGSKPLKLQLLFLQNNAMKNYRIELFNLFNGIDYENTLKIDGSRPGIFESRMLLDSKSAEAKLNKLFISQIANSLSSMSLSMVQHTPSDSPQVSTPTSTTTITASARKPSAVAPATAATTATTITDSEENLIPPLQNDTAESPSIPAPALFYQDKDYVLLPPLKPFIRPTLTHKSSQDTLISTPMVQNGSVNSVISNKNNSTAGVTTILNSPSLILKNNFDLKESSTSGNFDFVKKSPVTSSFGGSIASTTANATSTTAPTSPHAALFANILSESPRTVTSSHSLASKLNRLSNDLSTIVSTTHNSHDLLSHKLGSPLPPVMTAATSTVSNSGNSNASSQRTSVISTQVNGTSTIIGNVADLERNDDDNEYNSNSENDDPVTKSNTTTTTTSSINPVILYAVSND